MSMLAEPRSRQKWSQDPRNTNWSNDTSKFGYQMLQKMGWSEGKGLGQTLSGKTSHIRVTKNGSQAGLGLKKSHDDDWISHQEDFNALLSSLNQGGDDSTTKMSSLESRVKTSRKKILYKRFIKSKDLSNASSHDLACIFGQRSKSAPVTPQLSDNEEAKSDSDTNESAPPPPPANVDNDENDIKTIESQLSIADYFAKKMAALKQKKNIDTNNTNNENIVDNSSTINDSSIEKSTAITTSVDTVEKFDDTSIAKKKKKKKRKIEEVEDTTNEEENIKKSKEGNSECVSEIENGLVKKKKKKKSEKIDIEENVVTTIEPTNEGTEINKKKKKKKKSKLETDVSEELSEESNDAVEDVPKKKKKKKSKEIEVVEESAEIEMIEEVEEIPKKKKKKKKHNEE